jgi:4-hydroxythreonine-4-phosphate dehydrogenase
MNSFVFTCGDTNGIGPEIVIKTLNGITSRKSSDKFYFICPGNIFEKTIRDVHPTFRYEIVDDLLHKPFSGVAVINSGYARQSIGKPTITSGKSSVKSLRMSYELLKSKRADAVITAPISKIAIRSAGINFRGQTGMYAEWTNTKKYAMTFLSKKICVALLTIHNSLKDIPNLLKTKNLKSIIDVLIHTLIYDLRISKPKISVLGLNPHAGENGIIGSEDMNIIAPVIKEYKKKIWIEGPFSPDAFFARRLYENYDMILGMYHDQVLIPFKLLNSEGGVNYTAGLPIVRTSPDHGVAYDIAGTNLADESSMVQAYFYAQRIVKNRKKASAGK